MQHTLILHKPTSHENILLLTTKVVNLVTFPLVQEV